MIALLGFFAIFIILGLLMPDKRTPAQQEAHEALERLGYDDDDLFDVVDDQLASGATPEQAVEHAVLHRGEW